MIEEKIHHLNKLGEKLSDIEEVRSISEKAFGQNKWFTPDNVIYAIHHIKDNYLNAAKLNDWLHLYDLKEWEDQNICIGHLMAGNIPLVGFHDFLSAYILGFNQEIKLSYRDKLLLPFLISKLEETDESVKDSVKFVEQLRSYDAVIATGSNNTNRYFEYYFRKKPKILRRNRNSIAIIDGSVSEQEYHALAEDIFRYFGLGCRNVSKVYVPRNYDMQELIDSMDSFEWLSKHSSYMHNYDFNHSILILNDIEYLSNNFSLWVEDTSITSPLTTIHFEYYDSKEGLKSNLENFKDDIQCIVSLSKEIEGSVEFGEAQQPGLKDYADNVDVIKFLTAIPLSTQSI